MLRLLACAFLATAASAQITYLSAYLDGAQEVPPVPSNSHGWGVARFDASTNGVQLYCFHTPLVSGAIQGHMHIGPVGVGGGVIVGMTQIAPNTWSGAGTLTAPQAAGLLASGMYFNIHSNAFLGGEIRGQIVLSRSTRFTAVLNGAQEVPPNVSTATGTAVAFLHEPENRLVYMVNSTGLSGVVAAHFHAGLPGVNGPPVVSLNGPGGTYCGVSDRLTAADVVALKANGWYANIHTGAIPNGEIRGQLRKDLGDHFFAVADGAQETPPVVTTGLASGNITIAPDGTIVLTGAFSGLSGPAILAHVHNGAVGVAGPIVFNLTLGSGVLFGTHIPSLAELNDLRAGNWYINIHTGLNPLGEVRGQLLPATLPTTYGEGCATSLGERPQCGATGFAAMGSTVTFDLYGSLPAGFNIMVIGATREAPLPVQLPLIAVNAPECHVLTDIVLTYVVFSDSFGCAHQGLAIPLDPALRNIPLYTEWVTFDAGPGANPAGIVTSNALTFFVH